MFLDDSCIDLSHWDYPSEIGLITCPVGYGKTRYAIKSLPKYLEEQTGRTISKVLMLVPTVSIKEQILQNPELNAVEPDDSDYCGNALGESSASFFYVACFAKLGTLLSKGNKLIDFDLLIVDEIDLLLKWSCYQRYENFPIVWEWIVSKSEMLVCGLTATPIFPLCQLIDLEFEGYEHREFSDISKELKPMYQAEKVNVIPGIKTKTFLDACNKVSSKSIVYVQSAMECYRLAKAFPNSGFIVSKYNNNEPKGEMETLAELMDKQMYEGMTLRDYVVSKQRLPHDVQMLFINDSCSVGVSIKDPDVKHVVCATYDLDTIIQVQGRIRHDVISLAVCYTRYQPYEKEGYQWAYKSLDGSTKRNPIVDSYLEYCVEGNRKCVCSDSESYFEELEPYAASGKVEFLDADIIRRRLSAEYRNRNLDYLSALGLSDDCAEVWLTTKELTNIAKSLGVRKKSGRDVGGSTSLINAVNASSVAFIFNEGRITHDGKRCVWYRAAKSGAKLI